MLPIKKTRVTPIASVRTIKRTATVLQVHPAPFREVEEDEEGLWREVGEVERGLWREEGDLLRSPTKPVCTLK